MGAAQRITQCHYPVKAGRRQCVQQQQQRRKLGSNSFVSWGSVTILPVCHVTVCELGLCKHFACMPCDSL